MVFDSLSYALFFLTVFVLYWSVPTRLKIYLLLFSSYLFYSFNGLHVLPLIFASTVLDYFCAHKISKGEKKYFYLWVSIIGNLSLLGFYKYTAFAMVNLNWLISNTGSNFQFTVPDIHFPVGISFFTFQSMAYTIDVYRNRIVHEKNFTRFNLFVSYFPQLVAGPLERADKLLPQLSEPKFEAGKVPGAVLLIMWGLFKKTIVADRLHWIIKDVFESPDGMYSGLHHVFAALMIPFRFYCDFSGYCDIAMGCAALMGVQLTLNFHAPFWSSSVTEFWRRWHITLYEWFRDYVYVLFADANGSISTLKKFLAIFTVFLLSGFWHGPSWTFVVWGAINGIVVVLLTVSQDWRSSSARLVGVHYLPRPVLWIVSVLLTNFVIAFGCIFFQAHSMTEAMSFISQTTNNAFLPVSGTFFAHFHKYEWDAIYALSAVIFVQLVDLVEIRKHKIGNPASWPEGLVWASAWGLAMIVLFFGYENKTPFSYYYY
ncbi:MAG: MBOAT family O-acyltransferase [Bdellovibrionota bacterium]